MLEGKPQRLMDATEYRKMLDELAKRMVDSGKLIEAGWVAMRMTKMSATIPESQVRNMRLAYMAGAQHLYASMMQIMDAGTEPTDADLRRMGLIDAELNALVNELRGWNLH